MIFDAAEIELLRLAAWFKGLPSDLSGRFASQVFTPAGIEALQSLHLLYHSKERQQYRLTPTGWDFLYQIGFPYPQDAKYISDPVKLRRREQAAKVMFTFYRAGFHIFCDQLSDLDSPNVFLATEAMQRSLRRQNTKVWNGLRMCGVARLGDCGCLTHFTDEMGMYFINEMNRFQKAVTNCTSSISVYAADRYADAAYWVQSEPSVAEQKHKSDWTSFHSAARMTQLPLHLIECSDVGSVQLLLMRADHYREKAAKLVLDDAYRTPLTELPDTDAALGGTDTVPVVIAMDMAIKRIERACRTAFAAGHRKLSIVAFPEQMDALISLFPPAGKIEFYQVEKEQVMRAIGLQLYSPTREPFRNEKGGYIYVSEIPQRKKPGRPAAAQVES